ADLIRFKLVLEGRNQALVGGIEREVPLPPGEEEHRAAPQLVRGDLVRDHLLGSRQGPADDAPHAAEHASQGRGLRGNGLVYALEVGLCQRTPPAGWGEPTPELFPTTSRSTRPKSTRPPAIP